MSQSSPRRVTTAVRVRPAVDGLAVPVVTVRRAASDGDPATLVPSVVIDVAGAANGPLLGQRRKYAFGVDAAFDSETSTREVFNTVCRPALDAAAAEGTRPALSRSRDAICLLAYGHTNSGKTYTMFGSGATAPMGAHLRPARLDDDGAAEGLVGLAVDQLLGSGRRGETAALEVTVIEVYGSGIYDLLDGGAKRRARVAPGTGGPGAERVVEIPDATRVVVRDRAEWTALVAPALLMRRSGATEYNMRSSRSHCIATIQLLLAVPGAGPGAVRRGTDMCIVDLAGSERQSSIFAPSLSRESIAINKSLSALGAVIQQLCVADAGTDGDGRAAAGAVHFRASTLTQLLQRYLQGISTTTFVACVDPGAEHVFESLHTLRYVLRLTAVSTLAPAADLYHDTLVRREAAAAAAGAEMFLIQGNRLETEEERRRRLASEVVARRATFAARHRAATRSRSRRGSVGSIAAPPAANSMTRTEELRRLFSGGFSGASPVFEPEDVEDASDAPSDYSSGSSSEEIEYLTSASTTSDGESPVRARHPPGAWAEALEDSALEGEYMTRRDYHSGHGSDGNAAVDFSSTAASPFGTEAHADPMAAALRQVRQLRGRLEAQAHVSARVEEAQRRRIEDLLFELERCSAPLSRRSPIFEMVSPETADRTGARGGSHSGIVHFPSQSRSRSRSRTGTRALHFDPALASSATHAPFSAVESGASRGGEHRSFHDKTDDRSSTLATSPSHLTGELAPSEPASPSWAARTARLGLWAARRAQELQPPQLEANIRRIRVGRDDAFDGIIPHHTTVGYLTLRGAADKSVQLLRAARRAARGVPATRLPNEATPPPLYSCPVRVGPLSAYDVCMTFPPLQLSAGLKVEPSTAALLDPAIAALWAGAPPFTALHAVAVDAAAGAVPHAGEENAHGLVASPSSEAAPLSSLCASWFCGAATPPTKAAQGPHGDRTTAGHVNASSIFSPRNGEHSVAAPLPTPATSRQLLSAENDLEHPSSSSDLIRAILVVPVPDPKSITHDVSADGGCGHIMVNVDALFPIAVVFVVPFGSAGAVVQCRRRLDDLATAIDELGPDSVTSPTAAISSSPPRAGSPGTSGAAEKGRRGVRRIARRSDGAHRAAGTTSTSPSATGRTGARIAIDARPDSDPARTVSVSPIRLSGLAPSLSAQPMQPPTVVPLHGLSPPSRSGSLLVSPGSRPGRMLVQLPPGFKPFRHPGLGGSQNSRAAPAGVATALTGKIIGGSAAPPISPHPQAGAAVDDCHCCATQ